MEDCQMIFSEDNLIDILRNSLKRENIVPEFISEHKKNLLFYRLQGRLEITINSLLKGRCLKII